MTVESRSAQEIVGLVLAAGNSRRMGEGHNKLLEVVGGQPLVCWPVAALRDAGVARIVVVLGFEAEAVRRVLPDDVEFVEPADWAEGMGASLASGARVIAAQTGPQAVLVCVGDLPGLRASEVTRVIEAYAVDPDDSCICVPCFEGREGHPVLFGAAHLAALCELRGDRGGRAILTAHSERVRRIALPTASVVHDLDTRADLDAWLD